MYLAIAAQPFLNTGEDAFDLDHRMPNLFGGLEENNAEVGIQGTSNIHASGHLLPISEYVPATTSVQEVSTVKPATVQFQPGTSQNPNSSQFFYGTPAEVPGYNFYNQSSPVNPTTRPGIGTYFLYSDENHTVTTPTTPQASQQDFHRSKWSFRIR